MMSLTGKQSKILTIGNPRGCAMIPLDVAWARFDSHIADTALRRGAVLVRSQHTPEEEKIVHLGGPLDD